MMSSQRRFGTLLLPAALTLLVAGCRGDLGTEPGVRASAATAAATTYFGVCNADLGESGLLGSGWTRVFNDEFTGGLGLWKVWTGGAFNNELQLYRVDNLAVAPGLLTLEARKEVPRVTGPTSPYDATPKTFDYTSGRLESAVSFSAGVSTPRVRMAAKVRMPDGYGMWPAFWSYGDPWPTQGEIDIVEARGNEPAIYQTNYFYGRRAGQNLVRRAEGFVNLWSAASMTTCAHIYEVEWAKNSLTFYLDGQVVDLKTGGYIPNLFGKQQRAVLNLAVGGAFFTNLDATRITTGSMTVNWVKVFTHP